jgi:hypothetical protein
MNKHLRNYVTSALLLLPAAAVLVAVPTSVMAQPATPEVQSLDADADAGLQPGSMLRFRLIGTPKVQANVRVRGIRSVIVLRETAPGVYVGRYTLKRTDRVTPDAEVRAMLKRGNRIGAETFTLAETMNTAPVVTAPPPPPVPVLPALRIERFGMAPVERVEPGVELQFALEGMPGSTASVDLPGVERDLRLRETRPGHYEGGYTIRRADDINPNRPFVATLRNGDRTVTAEARLPLARPGADNRPPAGDNRPPTLLNLVPRDGEVVPAGQPLRIGANFEDRGGSGVDPASVQIIVSGRNVTREAQITRESFNLRAALPPGRHTVDVTARDQAGNTVRQGWSFDVAAAAPVNVPIQILNHSNNGQVGTGPTLVQGRTMPNANVAVTVNAVAPIGGVVNIQQQLLSQTVQADGNGNFAFSFSPQFPVPGTRYDITLVSTRGNLRDDHQLVLVQR